MDRSENRPPRSSEPHDGTREWQSEPLTLDPTPGEIIGQIGRTILICLILGLLARLLVPIVGMH